ncbi:hypothetical protein L915_13624, partial [Phytophthora nicotianae]
AKPYFVLDQLKTTTYQDDGGEKLTAFRCFPCVWSSSGRNKYELLDSLFNPTVWGSP